MLEIGEDITCVRMYLVVVVLPINVLNNVLKTINVIPTINVIKINHKCNTYHKCNNPTQRKGNKI